MQAVKIYLTATCPYCIRARSLLRERGVTAMEEIRVDLQPALRTEMTRITGRTSVPQPATFRADRPFVFAIRDRASGALLFVGRVASP